MFCARLMCGRCSASTKYGCYQQSRTRTANNCLSLSYGASGAAAFASMPYVTIRDDENRNPSGKTWNLVHMLRQHNKQHRFAWIGGNDIAEDMKNWYRGEELCRTLELLPVPRGGFGDAVALPEISSTAIRDASSSDPLLRQALPPAVFKLWQRFRHASQKAGAPGADVVS